MMVKFNSSRMVALASGEPVHGATSFEASVLMQSSFTARVKRAAMRTATLGVVDMMLVETPNGGSEQIAICYADEMQSSNPEEVSRSLAFPLIKGCEFGDVKRHGNVLTVHALRFSLVLESLPDFENEADDEENNSAVTGLWARILSRLISTSTSTTANPSLGKSASVAAAHSNNPFSMVMSTSTSSALPNFKKITSGHKLPSRSSTQLLANFDGLGISVQPRVGGTAPVGASHSSHHHYGGQYRSNNPFLSASKAVETNIPNHRPRHNGNAHYGEVQDHHSHGNAHGPQPSSRQIIPDTMKQHVSHSSTPMASLPSLDSIKGLANSRSLKRISLLLGDDDTFGDNLKNMLAGVKDESKSDDSFVNLTTASSFGDLTADLTNDTSVDSIDDVPSSLPKQASSPPISADLTKKQGVPVKSTSKTKALESDEEAFQMPHAPFNDSTDAEFSSTPSPSSLYLQPDNSTSSLSSPRRMDSILAKEQRQYVEKYGTRAATLSEYFSPPTRSESTVSRVPPQMPAPVITERSHNNDSAHTLVDKKDLEAMAMIEVNDTKPQTQEVVREKSTDLETVDEEFAESEAEAEATEAQNRAKAQAAKSAEVKAKIKTQITARAQTKDDAQRKAATLVDDQARSSILPEADAEMEVDAVSEDKLERKARKVSIAPDIQIINDSAMSDDSDESSKSVKPSKHSKTLQKASKDSKKNSSSKSPKSSSQPKFSKVMKMFLGKRKDKSSKLAPGAKSPGYIDSHVTSDALPHQTHSVDAPIDEPVESFRSGPESPRSLNGGMSDIDDSPRPMTPESVNMDTENDEPVSGDASRESSHKHLYSNLVQQSSTPSPPKGASTENDSIAASSSVASFATATAPPEGLTNSGSTNSGSSLASSGNTMMTASSTTRQDASTSSRASSVEPSDSSSFVMARSTNNGGRTAAAPGLSTSISALSFRSFSSSRSNSSGDSAGSGKSTSRASAVSANGSASGSLRSSAAMSSSNVSVSSRAPSNHSTATVKAIGSDVEQAPGSPTMLRREQRDELTAVPLKISLDDIEEVSPAISEISPHVDRNSFDEPPVPSPLRPLATSGSRASIIGGAGINGLHASSSFSTGSNYRDSILGFQGVQGLPMASASTSNLGAGPTSGVGGARKLYETGANKSLSALQQHSTSSSVSSFASSKRSLKSNSSASTVASSVNLGASARKDMVSLFSANLWASVWTSNRWTPLSQLELPTDITVCDGNTSTRVTVNGGAVASFQYTSQCEVRKVGAHDIEVKATDATYMFRSRSPEQAQRFFRVLWAIQLNGVQPVVAALLSNNASQHAALFSNTSGYLEDDASRRRTMVPPTLSKSNSNLNLTYMNRLTSTIIEE